VSIQKCSEPDCETLEGGLVDLIIGSRPKDLGGFSVRRVLPSAERRRVGPFVFFDHMGPATFPPGQGISVRPHPHIGLATVTFLFEGEIRHRDSLGSDQAITPGAVNWMTAGRGIVHSERTPEDLRASGSKAHGLQIWLALPKDSEGMEPSFVHHPASTLPRVTFPGVDLTLIAGAAYGKTSPVKAESETLFLAGELERGAVLHVPSGIDELAVYLLEGGVTVGGKEISPGEMAVLCSGASPEVVANRASLVAVVGGARLEGERHLWWNFVSSSKERLEQAKSDWKEGRFPKVPGDSEFIPLPES
jgi:redox-sensitive bicupin YhaK (pirin superfamily)